MYQSERVFKVWDYNTSHQQLLIRSPMTPGIETNIDMLFWGVKFLQLETTLRGIAVSRLEDHSAVTKPARRFIEDGCSVFSLKSRDAECLLIASGFRVLENEFDIFESTIATANDQEDRYVGVELARS